MVNTDNKTKQLLKIYCQSSETNANTILCMAKMNVYSEQTTEQYKTYAHRMAKMNAYFEQTVEQYKTFAHFQ